MPTRLSGMDAAKRPHPNQLGRRAGYSGAILQQADLGPSLGKVVGLHFRNQPKHSNGCPSGVDDESSNVLRLENVHS